MTNATELQELEERLLRLPFGEQLHLFERALANNRRKCEEARAWALAADAEFLAREKLQRERAMSGSPEVKRAAG